MRPVPRSFFARDAVVVAPQLLGKVLVAGDVAGRIVEVEAYRSDEPASHSHRGRTARNATMFGPAGHLYVYFTYGMHHCANVVTGHPDDGQGVLMRALTPIAGLEAIRSRRPPGTPERQWCDGPGKLCQALALTLADDGTDLCAAGGVWIGDDGTVPPRRPVVTPRVGISKAIDLPWRFVAPDASVSAVRRNARAGRGSRRGPASPPVRPATS